MSEFPVEDLPIIFSAGFCSGTAGAFGTAVDALLTGTAAVVVLAPAPLCATGDVGVVEGLSAMIVELYTVYTKHA